MQILFLVLFVNFRCLVGKEGGGMVEGPGGCVLVWGGVVGAVFFLGGDNQQQASIKKWPK